MRRSICMALMVALILSLNSAPVDARVFDGIRRIFRSLPSTVERPPQEQENVRDSGDGADDPVVLPSPVLDASGLNVQTIVIGPAPDDDPDKPARELLAALETAQPGITIYIDGAAEINLTKYIKAEPLLEKDYVHDPLCIKEGVTLKSNRKTRMDPSAGALIYTTETKPNPMLRVCGNNVRITGLRIYGADPYVCPREYPDACTNAGADSCKTCMPTSIGIEVDGYDNLEVDHCELAGWSFAAIKFTDSISNRVHHNYIHHNQREGLGYGVALIRNDGSARVSVDIGRNRFDYNRHAVAASGERGQSYDVHNNLVLENAISHVFDMHGEWETPLSGNEKSDIAGHRVLIHNNTVLVKDHMTMRIRGVPAEGAWFYSNCLARANALNSAGQKLRPGIYVACQKQHNCYVDERPNGTSASNRYGKDASTCASVRWCMSSGGKGPWTPLAISEIELENIALGDFDGDGITDVFRTTDSEWQWSRSGTERWRKLNASAIELADLRIGRFTKDNKADVFRATGDAWLISAGGTSPWSRINTSSVPLRELAFGDFDGDGRTDVFRATGSEWQWSRSGSESWKKIATSGIGLDDLVFGDFDGDGITDVFRATGSEWMWSRSAREPWLHLNTSGITKDDLVFGDFDGNGKTDVLYLASDIWYVSWNGTSSWEMLRIGSNDPADLAVGHFDNVRGADIFRTGCVY